MDCTYLPGLKGTVAWDFLSEVIPPKVPNWSLDLYTKAFLNIDSIRQEIWLLRSSRSRGHCGKFGNALWATTANLVVHYGPLRQIWLCTMGHYAVGGRSVKICNDFCAMGHSPGFAYVLWAIAQGLVIRYGPWRRIWLSAMGHGAAFGCALWALAKNQLS